jgi:hypothetical protein
MLRQYCVPGQPLAEDNITIHKDWPLTPSGEGLKNKCETRARNGDVDYWCPKGWYIQPVKSARYYYNGLWTVNYINRRVVVKVKVKVNGNGEGEDKDEEQEVTSSIIIMYQEPTDDCVGWALTMNRLWHLPKND